MPTTVYRPIVSALWSPEHAAALAELTSDGGNAVLARALVMRGIRTLPEAAGPSHPLHHRLFKGIDHAAALLATAIRHGERLLIVADYDCDGATACAIGVRGLRDLGADIGFLVPNRFLHGYGLTPSVVDLAVAQQPRWIITVDNGIASLAGVAAARARGWGVVVTDHHLPADTLPEADAIVNPNQPGCTFPSKNMAGCGVMWCVLAAVRAQLAKDGAVPAAAPPITGYLDLVALGTVADVVRLDANNRWLVAAGLDRIRRGATRPGVQALFARARRDPGTACAADFGFGVGPRLNAAGRLADMTTGIRCLLTDDPAEAEALAAELDSLNTERRTLEDAMTESALSDIASQAGRWTRVVADPAFHEGVVGLVASRVREQENSPTIAFANAKEQGFLKGSGRSVPGLHLRDALDRVHKRGGDLLQKFGGHAMAAGMTLRETDLPRFRDLFEEAVRAMMDGRRADNALVIDGDLDGNAWTTDNALALRGQVWGQGFEEPVWHTRVVVNAARRVGADGQHLATTVSHAGVTTRAIEFGVPPGEPDPQIGETWDYWYRLDAKWFGGRCTAELGVLQKHRA